VNRQERRFKKWWHRVTKRQTKSDVRDDRLLTGTAFRADPHYCVGFPCECRRTRYLDECGGARAVISF
jgi:hypothetical protein